MKSLRTRNVSIVLIIILLIIPTFYMSSVSSEYILKTSNTILFVGGSGLGNYTKIQDAIDNSSERDIIFVYNGTYHENLIVQKSVDITGEDKNNTVINGLTSGDTIRIDANNVNLSGFTVKTNDPHGNGLIFLGENNTVSNSIFIGSNDISVQCHWDNNTLINNYFHAVVIIGSDNNKIIGNDFFYRGIYVESSSHNNTILDNTINGKPLIFLEKESNKVISSAGQVVLLDCANITITDLSIFGISTGVQLLNSTYCTVTDSSFVNCSFGVILDKNSKYNHISDNIYDYCFYGAYIYLSSNNIIYNNKIGNSRYFYDPSVYSTAICLYRSDNNTFYDNTVFNTTGYGCFLTQSYNNHFYHNNFLNNTKNAHDDGRNYWNSSFREGNYWDDYTGLDNNSDGRGDTPYNISGGDNKDYYPVMGYDNVLPFIKIIKPDCSFYFMNHKLGVLPLNMPFVIGKLTIEANAFDNESGIKRVEFYIDDELKYSDNVKPYTYDWIGDKKIFFKRRHSIKVVAYDRYNNSNDDSIDVIRFL